MAFLLAIASMCSVLGFVLGLITTEVGRDATHAIRRSLRAPGLGPRVINQGIYDFFGSRASLSTRRSPEMFDYVKDAKQEIGIIAISLQRSVVHQRMHRKLEEMINANPDLQVYVFLLDPQSPVLSRVAKATERSEEELREAIKASAQRLTQSQSRVNRERCRLHFKFYDGYIANSLVAVDPEASSNRLGRNPSRFLVEHYLFGLAIDERYSFEVRRRTSPMFKKVKMVYHDFKQHYLMAP